MTRLKTRISLARVAPALAAPALAVLVLAGCGGEADSTDGGNNGPTISGTPPAQATVGLPWSFQPTVSDADGDALTFSVTNPPPWVALNTTTGRLQGTPQEADVATWNNIRLTVSDGQTSASLPSFSITVTPVSANLGTATLSWSPPTQRADGSPIGALAGYDILYGQESRNYSIVIELDNPGLTRYVIEGLGPGTWYFAVKAVTTDGLESAPSQEVSKTIG